MCLTIYIMIYIRKYGRLVNDFTEELLHARNQSDHYQSGFVISLLKGTALEELVTFLSTSDKHLESSTANLSFYTVSIVENNKVKT